MNAIAAYKKAEAITLEELAKRLNLKSRGYACDLVQGSAYLSVPLAQRLGELTGTPWHELLEAESARRAAKKAKEAKSPRARKAA